MPVRLEMTRDIHIILFLPKHHLSPSSGLIKQIQLRLIILIGRGSKWPHKTRIIRDSLVTKSVEPLDFLLADPFHAQPSAVLLAAVFEECEDVVDASILPTLGA